MDNTTLSTADVSTGQVPVTSPSFSREERILDQLIRRKSRAATRLEAAQLEVWRADQALRSYAELVREVARCHSR